MNTIGEAIGRIRSLMKANSDDAFVTDRYIYSLILNYAQVLMRRQDSLNKLMRFNSIWKTLPYVKLITLDKTESACFNVSTGSFIKRTEERLPDMVDGYWGPLIRAVTSLDGNIEYQSTQPGTYTSISKTTSFKYNNKKYFWFLDGYLYFPNSSTNAVKVEAVFNDDISLWRCEDKCVPMYKQDFSIPKFLFAEIENQVLSSMFNSIKIPVEDADNNKNINR